MTPTLPAGCIEHCPGCPHRGWSLEQSLTQKWHFLQQRLSRWRDRLQPVLSVAEPERWQYRDRVQLACQWDDSQGWQLGLRRRDELIAIPNCPIQSPRVNQAIRQITPQLPAPSSGFNLCYWVQSGAQLVLVLKQRELPSTDWLTPTLATKLQTCGLEGLWLHRHPSAGNRVFTKNGWSLLWGNPLSYDRNGLIHGPAAFQQLLPSLFNNALDLAEQFLDPGSASRVVDLYCGSGSSLRRWRNCSAATIGIEIGAEALRCATLNAPGATLLRGSCLHRLPQLEAWAATTAGEQTLLYTNPPRTGMETEVVHWIGQSLRPARLAYLSCSAGTLARDLELLETAGYRTVRLQPFDFFPHTRHVETLALLDQAPNTHGLTP